MTLGDITPGMGKVSGRGWLWLDSITVSANPEVGANWNNRKIGSYSCAAVMGLQRRLWTWLRMGAGFARRTNLWLGVLDFRLCPHPHLWAMRIESVYNNNNCQSCLYQWNLHKGRKGHVWRISGWRTHVEMWDRGHGNYAFSPFLVLKGPSIWLSELHLYV